MKAEERRQMGTLVNSVTKELGSRKWEHYEATRQVRGTLTVEGFRRYLEVKQRVMKEVWVREKSQKAGKLM